MRSLRLPAAMSVAAGVGASLTIAAATLFTNRTVLLLWFVDTEGKDVGFRLRWFYMVVIALGVIVLILRPKVLARLRSVRGWWVPLVVIAVDTVIFAISAWRLEAPIGMLRTLPSFAAFSSLAVGAFLAARDRRYADWTVAVTSGVGALAGLFQLGHRGGHFSLPGRLIHQWDLAIRGPFYGEFTYGRAQGFDINPDTYGLLGVVTFAWGVFAMRKGPLRTLSIMASMLTVGLSQSRTAVVLLAAMLVVAFFDLIRRRGGLLRLIIAAAFFVATAALVFAVTAEVIPEKAAKAAAARVSSGITATVGGQPQSDDSMSTRMEMWSLALKLYPEYPWGMWEQMGLKMPLSPHNEYIQRLVYAGPLFLVALVMLLAWLPIALRPARAPAFGVATFAWLALSCLVQDTTHALPMLVLGWFCIGTAMMQQAAGPGPKRTVFAGQGRWARELASGLERYTGARTTVVDFGRALDALDYRRWRTLQEADSVVLVGFRPGAATIRGRAFDFALDMALAGTATTRIHYWIGSDVQRAVAELDGGGDERTFRRLTARARHLAGSRPLLDDLAGIGIDAELAPFPWEGVPRLDALAPMPARFTVLSYVPDARPDFYGGPSLLAAARALPNARLVIMGGDGTWTTDAPGNVEFTGWIADPTPLYADASVVVRLAEYDSIGGTAVEGLVHGRPVVYSGVLEHTIHVDFDDPDALVATLTDLSEKHASGALSPDGVAAGWAAREFDPASRFAALASRLALPCRADMSTPRIAYLCLQATTEGQASHAHVHEIIAGLRALGLTVDLFEPAYAGGTAPGALGRLLEFRRVQRRLASRIRDYDAVYIRSHALAALAAHAATRAGVPVIQECNGPYDDLFLAWPAARPLRRPLVAAARRQYRDADALITVTPELAEWLTRESRGHPVTVVGNGANTELFHPGIARPDGLPTRYAVFFGALAPWQGISTALEAAASAQWPADVSLVVAGDGAQRSEVEEAAAEGACVYLGRVAYRELPGVIANSIASLVPKDATAHEASGLAPLKLYESMACGVPVVVSDTGGMGEAVRTSGAGVAVNPGDALALARAVAAIAADPVAAAVMGAAGRAAAVEHHSWAARAVDTADVIRSAIDRHCEDGA